MQKLILLDWDSTVIDPESNINAIDFFNVLQAKMNSGWQVGISSDTPLRRLRTWAKSLSLNGPIIAEKGAVVWIPDFQQVFTSDISHVFASIRSRLVEEVAKLSGYALFLGDNTLFIESVRGLRSNDIALVAIDSYRTCSIGLFVRKVAGNSLIIDQDCLETVYQVLLPLLPEDHSFSEHDVNFEFGFIAIHSQSTNKTRGTKELISIVGQPQELIMIGDSISDYIRLPFVRHFAVGNARPEFKLIAERVANLPYSDGCVELLNEID